MYKLMPSAFRTHDDWLAYVARYVPVPERAYALAAGRTELLKQFYELRKMTLPVELSNRLEGIHDRACLEDPAEIEALNDEILADLTVVLFNQALSKAGDIDTIVAPSPREQVRQLRDYIGRTNPYFRLWMTFKVTVADDVDAGWEALLSQEFGSDRLEEVEFAHAMAELDKLLLFFHDNNRALPRFSFERVWFLHHLRAPERMVQTRSVLALLMEGIGTCTSA
jgi:hypothetical protein